MIPTGPDARTYGAQARTLRERLSFRPLVDRYLEEPSASAFPSPLRWLWLALLATTIRMGQRAPTIASACLCPLALGWATVPLIGTRAAALGVILGSASPLLWTMGRRALQDAPVALVTLLAVGSAVRHEPLGLAVATLALLGLKEAAMFALPGLLLAWVVTGPSVSLAASAIGAGALAWLVATRALLGPRTLEVFRRARSGHDTDYTRKHQRGGLLRLAADIFLVSPVALTLGAVSGGPAALIAGAFVGFHAVAPVVNLRFVIAAELLLRAAAASWLATNGPAWLAPCFAADAFIAWKLRRVYDPVTSALTTSLGMTG